MKRIPLLVKSIVAYAIFYTGLYRLIQKLRKPHIVVLAYHRVTPDKGMAECPYPAMHVSTSSFEQQIRLLQDLYRIIPMTELQKIMNGNQRLRSNVAVITFDDGYRDNYRNAFPVLQRQDIPATFFLSLGFLDSRESFWFDQLAEIARAWQSKNSQRSMMRGKIPPQLVNALDMTGPFEERLRAAVTFMKSQSDVDRKRFMQVLQGLLDPDSSELDSEPMAWDEVQRMQESGMRFGAHSISHAILTKMETPEARTEILGSVTGVSERLGTNVEEFAYPNGDTNAQVSQLTRESGAKLAFTMEPKLNTPEDNALQLGRYNMCEATSQGFFGKFSQALFVCEVMGVFEILLQRRRRSENDA